MVDCTRGTTWSTVETLCLIDCWSEDEIETDLSGVHRNRHVYSKISYKMREHGYLRSWDACKNKIKSLRVQYLRAKQQNNTSGQERTKFMFFEHIDKFMGTRPIVQPELVVNAGAQYINIDEENESTENEPAQENEEIQKEIDVGDDNLKQDDKDQVEVKEKESKTEITYKKTNTKTRKRKNKDVFGTFMHTLKEMECSNTKLFLEQEAKIRKEENRQEQQRIQSKRQFQMQMFEMQQKLQMQMMTMFGQQISSVFGNDPCQSTSGKPATNGSGDATENSRNQSHFFEMQDALHCLDQNQDTYTNL